jgi:hypothetical protein
MVSAVMLSPLLQVARDELALRDPWMYYCKN